MVGSSTLPSRTGRPAAPSNSSTAAWSATACWGPRAPPCWAEASSHPASQSHSPRAKSPATGPISVTDADDDDERERTQSGRSPPCERRPVIWALSPAHHRRPQPRSPSIVRRAALKSMSLQRRAHAPAQSESELVGRPGLDPGTLGSKVQVRALRHVTRCRTSSQKGW